MIRLITIVLGTVLMGTLFLGLFALAAVLGLQALDAPPAMTAIAMLVILPGSYVLAGYFAVKRNPPKEAAAGPAKVRRGAAVGIGLLALALVVGGILLLESRAEKSARAFCAAALPGTPMAKVADAARDAGTKMLRRIEPEAVAVGFTGVPPFSRHLCTVRGTAGVVSEAAYSYLD
jgi:hypothetical protein